MHLAKKGWRVLLLDRATFPSDTISTHLIHPPGVDALKRWGLLDKVTATGCPPIHTYSYDFGDFKIEGPPGPEESPISYAPRRTVLDKILVDAAREAGVEVRESFTVDDIIIEDGAVVGIRGHSQGGSEVEERATVVVGADGRQSQVVRAVQPEQYEDRPQLLAAYYTYWSGLPMDGVNEVHILPYRGFAAWPTNDDLTLVIAGWPYAEFEENRKDIEGNYHNVLSMVPQFAERIKSAKQEERFLGTAVPNYFRKPFGKGWALVGDAGYNKDFITAFGITDAFSQSELCSDALDHYLSGSVEYDESMAKYQSARDEAAMPYYHLTCDLATLSPPTPEIQQVLEAVSRNKDSMADFTRMNGACLSPAQFFSEENVGRVFANAH
jgi:2-polyprenyl-6-methoxyphenol hydroxylase-like FAD-dependent oxidoreductase